MNNLGITAERIAGWRAHPATFVEQALVDPETGLPYKLLEAEKAFFEHAFRTDAAGKALYAEQVYAAPKKSGKTAFAALHVLTTTLLFGGAYAEATLCANDYDQAQGRVFEAVKRIVEQSPFLQELQPKISANKITFGVTGATITAIASDYAGAAGGNPTISNFDELWAYTSERSRRLWDGLVPPPTRKFAVRLTVTYAGFEGESALLEELYKRGLQQPLVGTDLYAGNGLLMFWSHVPIAPWQSESWVEQMRSQLRPNAFLRMIENRFVSTESTFIDLAWWDRCVDPLAGPVLTQRELPVWVGVDASVKHDSSAVVAVTFDRTATKVRLVAHRIFQPTPDRPLDFEATIEASIRDFTRRFNVRGVHYDPYQMAAVAQRLQVAGIPMREYAQTTANLTAMGSNLYELVKGNNIVVYADDAIRLAVSRTISVETPRGLRLAKEKQSHKIDVIVALAMAALHAVEQGEVRTEFAPPIMVPLAMPSWCRHDYGLFGGEMTNPAVASQAERSRWPVY
jgi:phage terminase large subunit-like protein